MDGPTDGQTHIWHFQKLYPPTSCKWVQVISSYFI